MTPPQTGAEAFCAALEREGVGCVFGLPGTQTVALYEALRHSAIRAIVPTHELGAAFMAYGYARASGKPGVLLTIPGPGFAFAPAGLAEAKLDGVPVVHFTVAPSRGPTGEPAFQALDQAAIARPLVKAVFRAETRMELPSVVREALRVAMQPEPGPVFVEMTEAALRESLEDGLQSAQDHAQPAARTVATADAVQELVELVARAKRPAFFVAGDCSAVAASLSRLAVAGRTPVFVPPPSRGVMPEDHPWMLCCDDQRTRFESIQAALALADPVVILGTRLTHVATAGFRLKFAAEHTVCLSESGATLPHGYKAALTLHASMGAVLERLESEAPRFASCWLEADVREWRARFTSNMQTEPPEPVVNGGSAAAFFTEMRSVLPRDAIVVTDSGLHQALVRRHFPVLGTSGLVFPCELQSMGFGLPAAIGAKLAQPKRVVVVVMGDGGFAMTGLELLTAVRDDVQVITVVFNDGKLNLIRLQQLREYGVAHGTDLRGPDLERFAEAVGVRYLDASPSASAAFQDAVASGQTTIIEVVVGDSNRIRRVRATSHAKEALRRAIGPRIVNWLKRRLR